MWLFIARRLLLMVPTLIVISMASFAIIHLPPGDFLTVMVAEMEATGDKVNAETVAQLRERYGLDQPMPVQYWRWISGIAHGDFGQSFIYNKPVSALIWERLGLTAAIAVLTLLVTWLISIPIGIYSAVRQYTVFDYALTFFGFIGMAAPAFTLALVVMYFAYKYFGISVGGLFSERFTDAAWSWLKFVDFLKHVWIPVVVLAVGSTAGMIRTLRANLLDQLEMPYVVTARAKGVPPLRLLLKYPVRVAINPLISSVGWLLPWVISGSVIVATVLNLPTTGPLLLKALYYQDMYLAGSFILLLSVLTVLGTLVSDILLAWLDPRIRFEARQA
jgi:peptide/nickel transport system permease protein